ncbi:MAG: Rne/Rng family ribonuclease, partial [Bacteroidota bacterium]
MSQNDIIIQSSDHEVTIALLNERRLVELHQEKKNNNFAVGDIYLGKIRKVMPGLNAAFVDIGYEKDAFLHYLDLGPQFNSLQQFVKQVTQNKQQKPNLSGFQLLPDIDKGGKITSVLSTNHLIPVQIAKEPIANKGPRITSDLSIPGRYVVLIPFSDKVSISQKIKSTEEKDRLRKIIQGLRPKNYGVIVRTVAENKGVSEIENDLKELLEKWDSCFEEIKTSLPPKKVLGELDRTSTILRDMLNSSFSSIHVNEEVLYEEIRNYLGNIAPEKRDIVKLYKSKEPIFDHFGVDRQLKASFGKTVPMKSGSYLIVEHTEAMHVIDVNSGHRQRSDMSQETNALEVNLDAATEVARQLRLRDMGGIIVVDFIDMHSPDNRKLLFNKLKDEMRSDRAKHTILPPTKFGLVQITRQRVRPEMNVSTLEKCPTCQGSGEVQASILLIDQIENNLRYILLNQNKKGVTLALHPFLEAYFKKGFPSPRMRWFM